MKKIVLFILTVGSILLSVSSCKKEETDPCETVSCLNGGTCNNGTCACSAGYEGANCQTEKRAKFFGTYYTIGCGENYFMSISNSGTGILNVLLNFPDDFGVPPISAVINGNSLTIPSQSFIDVDGFAVTFSGSGSISGNVLTWTLVVNYDGFTDSCTYISQKQ